MIRSMTGFGDAAATAEHTHYAVELRSLNNRYFKATFRLPETLTSLEGELEQQLKRHVHRGSLTLTVKVKTDAEAAVSRINDDALAEYLSHLTALRTRLGSDGTSVDLTALMSLPGVLEAAEDDATLVTRSRPVIARLVDEAAEKLNRMRQSEGHALSEDLKARCVEIRERVQTVRDRAPAVVEEYHDRLRARIDDLMQRAELEVDRVDLVREVAIFADRSDVAEEVSRTLGHLDQFLAVIERDNNEPDGRTLDFIAQELLREANTIASKSNDAEISRAAVEMKSAIDRIKEQVQNVE